MRLKNRFVYLIVIMLSSFLVGCGAPKCVSSEMKTVTVRIVKTEYKPAYSTLSMVGKVTMSSYHPEEYLITVDYEGVEFTLSKDEEVYYQYQKQTGKNVEAFLKEDKYNDGKTYYSITDLVY